MSLALAALLAVANDAPVENDGGVEFTVSRGGTYLIVMGGVLGSGAATAVLGARALRGSADFTLSGPTAAGLFVLFVGGGLTGARLLDPSPPAAWGSAAAGAAGAGIVFYFVHKAITPDASVELTLTGMSLGYLAGAAAWLALPHADVLTWKELAASVGTGALFSAVFFLIANARQNVIEELNVLALIAPALGLLAGRLVFAFWQPFDPWVDEWKPPFRAQPIVAMGPTGASMGIAGSW